LFLSSFLISSFQYQIDKEMGKESTKPSGVKSVDAVFGIDFFSVNEFISGSGSPTASSTRSLTIDLVYEQFLNIDGAPTRADIAFSEVLRHSISRETRLRAWNKQSQAYETILQRKIVTSLPSILTLSCKEGDGLGLWRSRPDWLPELIEVSLAESGDVTVRERNNETETWLECQGTTPLQPSVTTLLGKRPGPVTIRYQLEAVVSLVIDHKCRQETGDEAKPFGHHVLHCRLSRTEKLKVFEKQRKLLTNMLSEYNDAIRESPDGFAPSHLLRQAWIEGDENTFRQRLEALDQASSEWVKDEWILLNGLVVSKTDVRDAQGFRLAFREPSLVLYRDISTVDETSNADGPTSEFTVGPEVIRSKSITDGSLSPHSLNQKADDIPGRGDLVAFDAEFVSVQSEESTLNDQGSKVVTREVRHAVARISAIDCRRTTKFRTVVLFDDYVVPQEPVTE
jgi:Ubiquitin carboxyl-terminal hydrolase